MQFEQFFIVFGIFLLLFCAICIILAKTLYHKALAFFLRI